MTSGSDILQLQARSTVGKLQILSAAGELFNHVDVGGPMWSAHGDRSVELAITFLAPFSFTPQVVVSLSGIDSAYDQNLRVQLFAQDITPSGFTLVCRTWGDTHIARASASWQALGSL